MTATTTPSCTRYQDIHTAIPLTPTRCHPTAHSHGFTPAASIADRIRARAASPCTGEGFDHGVLVIAEAEGLRTNEPMTALLRGELHTARGRTPMHPGPSAAP